MWTVYALIDPRTQDVMYVGETSQPIRKRLSDHHSMARLREKRNLPLTPTMVWLNALDRAGYNAIIKPLKQNLRSAEDAKAWETRLQLQHGATILNKLGQKGGRPVGTHDSSLTKRRKRKARKAATKVFQETYVRSCIRRRQELGYPHPELPAVHPFNQEHYKTRKRTKPVDSARSQRSTAANNQRFYAWRVAVGYPNPHEGSHHPDNYAWRQVAKPLTYKEWCKRAKQDRMQPSTGDQP